MVFVIINAKVTLKKSYSVGEITTVFDGDILYIAVFKVFLYRFLSPGLICYGQGEEYKQGDPF